MKGPSQLESVVGRKGKTLRLRRGCPDTRPATPLPSGESAVFPDPDLLALGM